MNARDFCFWIQGYIELTGSEYPPSVAWGLILEHLELANLQRGFSEEEFENVTDMLTGFVSVAGSNAPSEEQWKRIVDIVSDTFVKVTSKLDEVDPDNNPEDIIKIIKDEIEKNRQKNPIIPPYQPYPVIPWREDRTPISPLNPWTQPPIITCSDLPSDNTFCSAVETACSEIESVQPEPLATVFGEDMYSSQVSTMNMYELGIDVGKND